MNRRESNCPLGFKFCPLSLLVFMASSAYITFQKRQALRTDNDDDQDGDTIVLPSCHVVFVLGGPGAGKGTQCELLTQRLPGKWQHLSTGDLLRAERKKGGPLGDELNSYISNGQLVPSKVTCRLLELGMKRTYKQNKSTNFLIDGFPRSFENATVWEQTMSKHVIDFVLHLTCPEEVLTGRLLHRGQTSNRVDDSDLEIIQKRFATHQRECAPIIEHYEQQQKSGGTKIYTILSDKPVEDVYKEIEVLFH